VKGASPASAPTLPNLLPTKKKKKKKKKTYYPRSWLALLVILLLFPAVKVALYLLFTWFPHVGPTRIRMESTAAGALLWPQNSMTQNTPKERIASHPNDPIVVSSCSQHPILQQDESENLGQCGVRKK
jgi:hypothetical protein